MGAKNYSSQRLGKSATGKSTENFDSKNAYGNIGNKQQPPTITMSLSNLTQRQQASTAERAKINTSAPIQKQNPKTNERNKYQDNQKAQSRNQSNNKSNANQNLKVPQRQPLNKPALPTAEEFMRKEQINTPESMVTLTGASVTHGTQDRSLKSS